MGWQAGTADGTGKAPGPRRWLPSARDLLLAGLTRAGGWDRCPPAPDQALAVEEACGADWSCPGARHEELTALLGRWQALESWAAAGKLGVLRALIGEEQWPALAGTVRAGLPQEWSKSLTCEVALTLGMSAMSADKLMWTAWDLKARLPGIGQRLADGKLTLAKARAVDDALAPLSGEDVIMAEELVLDRLAAEPSMTYAQLERAATWAAVLVDPDAATRRREGAERENARVAMFRESSGAAGLSGRDLPTDQTLTANARVADRAAQYKDSGAFPGAQMDWLRAVAFLDLLNDITAGQRISFARAAAGQPAEEPGPDDPDGLGPDDPGLDGPGPDEQGGGPAGRGGPGPGGPDAGAPCPCRECDGSCNPLGDDDSDPGPGPGPAGDDDSNPGPGPGGDDSDPGPGPGPGSGPDGDVRRADQDQAGGSAGDRAGTGPAPDGAEDGAGPAGAAGQQPATSPPPPAGPAPAPRLTDLVIPLVTLFGWDQRPGESHGLGPLDPALCRTLAALAAASPHTQTCLTITTDNGIAAGHGCTRPARGAPANRPGSTDRAGPPGPHPTLPARLNLTITAYLRLGEDVAAWPGWGAWS